MASKIQKHNKNGDEICHAFGCRKHKNLKNIFNGKFCRDHEEILSKIRINIYKSKKYNNIESENYWRQQEIEFRKFHDQGHMIFKLKIENLYIS